LRGSELHRYFAHVTDAVVVADSSKRLVYLNNAAEALFKRTLSSGKPLLSCADLFHLEPHSRSSCFVEEVLYGRRNSLRTNIRLPMEQGNWLSFTVSASAIQDIQGAPGGCLAILRPSMEDLDTLPEIQDKLATLSSILENFPTPFFTVGPDLVITFMNRYLEELTGYRREEVVGRMTCAKVLCTKECQTDACVLRQAMEYRRPLAGIRRVIRSRDGREIPVVVNASLITDPSGRVIGGYEAIRDITPIVEAQKKVEILTEMTQEGILMVDQECRVIFANSKMAEIVGSPKSELIGRTLAELLTSQHEEMVKELLQRADLEDEEQLRFCSTLQLSHWEQGDSRIYETCMSGCRLGSGRTVCVYLRDLTKRIEIERQLRKANSFLQNIIQSSVDGIVVTDTSGTVMIFNEGAERILGYQAEEIVGKPGMLSQFYDPELAREIMRKMRADEHGPPGKLNPTRISFTDKQGQEVPVNFSAAIIQEGERELGSVGIFSDLREHERMRRQLEQTQRQLVQAEKIASLGRLAAGVAHEINNPLAGILIYADMLMKEIASNEQWRADLQEIINQTLRCKQIVTRLLEFSRQSLGQKFLFDVNDVIKQSVELLRHQALFHNIEFVLQLDSTLPQILGDPGELQQVFTNLILNAADAMDGKGKITVVSKTSTDGSQIVLTFSDTGPGIPPEDLDKIFEPFFTTKPLGKGTGLGLSVVYGVIQRHGGSIEVQSPAGQGATFLVTLPVGSGAE